MRQDEFLVRFLRDRNLNVENAKKKLIQVIWNYFEQSWIAFSLTFIPLDSKMAKREQH